MITGHTEIIAHIGYPTHSFKAPMIYNPYFESAKIDAVVVPMGCKAEDYPPFLKAVFSLQNIRGALITMPHKVATVGLLDEVSAAVKVAGACNAVKRLPDGRLVGDMFDGEGFVRGVLRKGLVLQGARVLVVRGTEADALQSTGQGRDWLSAQLQQAGAQVQALASYMRCVPVWDAAQCAQARLAAQDGSIWLFSSSQALKNLQTLLPAQDWARARALVTHPRIAETAQSLGWGVVRTSRPAPTEIRASLECFA